MGPIQPRALASPPERWVSFRAGRWKGFVFGKGLRMSGDGAGKHPNPGEAAPGSWAILSPFALQGGGGRRGKSGQKGILGVALLFLFFPALRWPSHSSVVLTFLGLARSHQGGALYLLLLATWTAAETSNSSKFCLLSLQ